VATTRRERRLTDEQLLSLMDVIEGSDSVELKLTLPEEVHRSTINALALDPLEAQIRRAFYEEHAGGIALDDLTTLGPLFVLKLRFAPEGFGRKMVGEMWLYPDGSRVLELSTKCAPTEAFQVAAEARAFLARQGIDLEGEQQTKTRKALEFFADAIRAADGPQAA